MNDDILDIASELDDETLRMIEANKNQQPDEFTGLQFIKQMGLSKTLGYQIIEEMLDKGKLSMRDLGNRKVYRVVK